MKETLSIQREFKPAGTHKYLYEQMPVGTYEVEGKSHPIVDADDPRKPTTQILFIHVEPNEETQLNDIKQALEDCLVSHGCVTSAEELGKNYWRVEILLNRVY